MKRLIALVFAAALALGACSQDASKTDLEEPRLQGDATPKDYRAVAPDAITVFQNIDNHPTIARICADGVAFRTISSTHSGGLNSGAVERVPEWDEFCESFQ